MTRLKRGVWYENTGTMPNLAKGKRVRVKIRHIGDEPRYDDGAQSPPGWAADGPGGCRWSLRGDPHDITHFMIL